MRLASGSHDKRIKIWDAQTGQEVLSVQGHEDDVRSVTFSPDGLRLASASADGTVRIWGDNSWGSIQPPRGLSNVVAIAAGGQHCAALKSDSTVVSWGANYAGQTNLPAGLSNVVAISAGHFQDLALKQDGTVVLVYTPLRLVKGKTYKAG